MEPEAQQWRIARKFVAVKIAATAVFALAALWFSADPTRLFAALAATVVAGIFAARDLIAPIRLQVDMAGLTVSRGFMPRHQLTWHEVADVRVDRRRRFATTTSLLEIDADETLYLFSRLELDAEPEEVAKVLQDWKQAATSSGSS